jgi:hypothetical protein
VQSCYGKLIASQLVMLERPTLKPLLIAVAACVLLSSSLLGAQGRSPAPPPGSGGTPPAHGGPIPGKTPKVPKGEIAPVVAPEFDPRSAGAVWALLIGGSLVLLETRRRLKSQS